MSDKTWDARFDELTRLEMETGVILSGSTAVDVQLRMVSGRYKRLMM